MTIDEPLQEDEVKNLLHDVIVKQDIQNANIEFQQGSKVGEGFLGITNAIVIRGNDKELKLFIKAASKNQNLRKILLSRLVFLKEIHFYEKILPIYDDFLQTRIGASFDLTAKCYAINSEEYHEALVFENLKEQGFKLFDKKQCLDENHVLLVLRSYAKLHGTGYALKDQCPDIYKTLFEKMTDDTTTIFRNFGLQGALIDSIKTLREHLDGNKEIFALDELDKITEKLMDFMERSEGDQRIIIHGDCWMNNMLFKYKEDNKTPTEMKLLDFQMNRVRLPVYDLSYFLYCSAGSPENLAKLDYYLEYYYKFLCDYIEKLGSDGQKIYPYEIFMEHWKEFCKYGLLITVGFIKILLADNDKTPNIAEKINLGSSEGLFDVKLSNIEVCAAKIRPLLVHFVDKEFL